MNSKNRKSALILTIGVLIILSGCILSALYADENVFGVRELESLRPSMVVAEGSTDTSFVNVILSGKVEYPGVYRVNDNSGVIGALLSAGGICREGSMRNVEHWRNEELLVTYDLYRLLNFGADAGFLSLENDDRIMVPEAGAMISIQGDVSRPGLYELLAGSISPSDAVRLAGGLLHPDREAVVNFLFMAGAAGLSSEISLSCLVEEPVRIRGRVAITVVAEASQRPLGVSLEGAVSKNIPWHSALNIRKVMQDCAEIFSQNAYSAYAEVLRPGGVDDDYQVLTFSPEQVLQGGAGDDLMLRPGDRIVIFPADLFIKAAKVNTEGRFNSPGSFPFSQGMRAADLLSLSGGISSGSCTRMYLVRRQIANNRLNSIEIELTADYLAGNQRFNIMLKPFDTLVVE